MNLIMLVMWIKSIYTTTETIVRWSKLICRGGYHAFLYAAAYNVLRDSVGVFTTSGDYEGVLHVAYLEAIIKDTKIYTYLGRVTYGYCMNVWWCLYCLCT